MRIIITAIFAALMAWSAGARTLTSLAECIDAAVDSSPALRAARLEARADAADRGTAWDLPATEITLSQTPVDGGGPENALTFTQTFDFPTVYAAKRRTLQARADLGEARADAALDMTVRRVTLAYDALAAAMATRDALAARDSICSRLLQIARARLDAGDAGQLEVIGAKRLLDDNRLQLLRAEGDVTEASLLLREAMGTDCDVRPAAHSALPLPEGLPELDDLPALRAASLEETVARREVSEAGQAFLPTFSVSASAQALIKSFNPYGVERERFRGGNFMGFEAGVSIPLFFGSRRAALQGARHRAEAAAARAEAARTEALAARDAASARLRTAAATLAYHEGAGRADSDELMRIAAVSYELGDIGYTECLQAMQTGLEQLLARIEAMTAYNRAVTDLLYPLN